MARDFENMSDPRELSDDELRVLVETHFDAHNGLDPDYITVRVSQGCVTLEGRVGTDYERRAAEHVVTDVLGLAVANNLVIDPLHRAESDGAIDDHLAEEDREHGLLLGDRPVPLSPEAEHLVEDLDARLYGTTDVGKAIANGLTWIPPESPTGEGLEGTGGGTIPGEDH